VLSLTLAATGCGGATGSATQSSLFGSGQPTAAPSGSGSAGATTSAAAVPTVPPSLPGDTTVTLTPQLYPTGGDCAGVAKTEAATEASSNCTYDFLTLSPSLIPGQADVVNLPMPVQVTASRGVSASTAASMAGGFYLQQAIRYWALEHPEPAVITAVDGVNFSHIDPVAAPNIHWAPPTQCLLPTQLRVVPLSGTALQYLEPGATSNQAYAVVATYPACDGLKVFSTGQPVTYFAYPSARSLVYAGSVQTVPPFAPIMIIAGVSACGPQALSVVCG
jgi:hypothetical protein